MSKTSENDDTHGWVKGDLPAEPAPGLAGGEAAPHADEGPAAAPADLSPPEPAAVTELAVADTDPILQADLHDLVSDVAALVESTFDREPTAVEPGAGEPVPLEAEPPASPAALAEDHGPAPVVAEAELQAEAIAAETAAAVVTEANVGGPGEVPITSEAEVGLPVDETPAHSVSAPKPSLIMERPIESQARAPEAGEPTSGPEAQPDRPRKRGKKSREPLPAAAVEAAVNGLNLASQAENGPPLSLGPAVAVGDLGLEASVESLLFVADGAVPIARLAEALEISPREVEAALAALAESYQHRGLSLQRFRDRVQLTTAPAAAALVERFLGLAASTPLSRAALEALAIIAYQQPVTRPQIEAVRGVNSDSVIKNLLTKGLIEESGRAEGPGRPVLYSTTTEFMQHFGLASLSDLPPLTMPAAGGPAEARSADDLLKG